MCTMSVAGIVQMLCAIPVWLATSKNCVSDAGDSRRFAASPADIVDWTPSEVECYKASARETAGGAPMKHGMEFFKGKLAILNELLADPKSLSRSERSRLRACVNTAIAEMKELRAQEEARLRNETKHAERSLLRFSKMVAEHE